MQNLEEVIPILSLAVAVLAVLVGPFISHIIARKQIENTVILAKKNIVAPIRQRWINELREILAELTTTCTYFWSEVNEEKKEAYHLRIRSLIGKLELYINPWERVKNEI